MEEFRPQQQVKMEIDHGKQAFYCNDFAVLVPSAKQIVIDFRQTLPRMDVVGKDQSMTSLAVKHNPIVLQPETLKMLSLMLRENVKKLEKDFGEIPLPKEWMLKSAQQQAKDKKSGKKALRGKAAEQEQEQELRRHIT